MAVEAREGFGGGVGVGYVVDAGAPGAEDGADYCFGIAIHTAEVYLVVLLKQSDGFIKRRLVKHTPRTAIGSGGKQHQPI